jgi:3-hydroxymyristoyl/3-hydroxydecanoyl-(acyl carrier protein) dehydratase
VEPHSDHLNYFGLTLDLLSDQRAMMHRSHEAFLEYGHQTMKTEREALFLKLALGKGLDVSVESRSAARSKWDLPVRAVARFKSDKPAQFGLDCISEFATGSLVKCFGNHYSIYNERKAPRTPNGDLLLMSRIIQVEGNRGEYNQGASLVAEYDVEPDAWFYQHNSAPVMPYSMLMEIALQPCGFLATYMGCTLIYPDLELCFRNLDSTAELLKEFDLRNRTITAKSVLKSVASSAETVIVQFDYELSLEGTPFYRGDTTFGYFTPGSLVNQIGLDRGAKTPPWYNTKDKADQKYQMIDLGTAEARKEFFEPKPGKPYFYQASNQLNFLGRLLLDPLGGDFGQGYVYGDKQVDPDDWFFPCHFYQDPVMPGSLGVESILQAIRMFAIRQKLGDRFHSPCFTNAISTTVWKYRGQIIKTDDRMFIEAHIKNIENLPEKTVITADASLWKDGLRIYELTNVAIVIIESAI